MSDSTKKSIVINKSFLSGSSGSSESTKNKSRKQSRPKIPDEVIKPSKLKQMLLDKINAKRRAELNMASATPPTYTTPKQNEKENTKHKKHRGLGVDYGRAGSSEPTSGSGIDKEKEAKIFSDEFKKSLSFLDKYIQTKDSQKIEKNQHRQHSKTLKRASGTSLNEDILKSLHNSKNNNHSHSQSHSHSTSPHRTPLNVNTQLYQKLPTAYAPNVMQRSVSPSRAVSPIRQQHGQPNVSFATHQTTATPTPPGFQKIQLNIPKVNTTQTMAHIQPKNEKITLALGKPSSSSSSSSSSTIPGTAMTDAGNLIYTELPPELMPNAPMNTSMLPVISTPVMPTPMLMSSPALSPTSIPMIETFELSDSEPDPTSLKTSTPTFSPVKLTDDKPYGCLKNGKKPTFRLYNKTIKHSHSHEHEHDVNNGDNIYAERQQKLNDLRNKHNHKVTNLALENGEKGEKGEKHENKINNSSSSSSSSSNRVTKIRKRLRKTITKRFKLGKQGNVVGVLIKNNDTRKKIQKEHGLLKNKNLSDVKKYLVEQKLMKIGSTAPPNIIRKIYEDSVLTGEVENMGKDVILHNFLEQNKPW